MMGPDPLKENLLKSSFGIKSGDAKQTVFSLEQKEIMIEFNNRQANQGIHANLKECIAVMRERGLEVLKESHIKSWWSTYHQKRKKEMERMAADLQSLREVPLSQVTNPPACSSASELTSTSTSVTGLHTATSPVTVSSPLAYCYMQLHVHATASTTSLPNSTGVATPVTPSFSQPV